MIKADAKAQEILSAYGETEGIVHATQCLVLAPIGPLRDYWWNVVELIKYNGGRHNQIQKGS